MERSKKNLILILSLVVVVILSLVGFMMAGYLYIGVKNPGQKVLVHYSVCGGDIVDQYNNLYKKKEGYLGLYFDDQGLEVLANNIKDKPNHENDPTCQSILLRLYIYKNDKRSAKSAYDRLQRLQELGISADGRFNDLKSFKYYNLEINNISTE